MTRPVRSIALDVARAIPPAAIPTERTIAVRRGQPLELEAHGAGHRPASRHRAAFRDAGEHRRHVRRDHHPRPDPARPEPSRYAWRGGARTPSLGSGHGRRAGRRDLGRRHERSACSVHRRRRARDFITKPFDVDGLLQLVDEFSREPEVQANGPVPMTEGLSRRSRRRPPAGRGNPDGHRSPIRGRGDASRPCEGGSRWMPASSWSTTSGRTCWSSSDSWRRRGIATSVRRPTPNRDGIDLGVPPRPVAPRSQDARHRRLRDPRAPPGRRRTPISRSWCSRPMPRGT